MVKMINANVTKVFFSELNFILIYFQVELAHKTFLTVYELRQYFGLTIFLLPFRYKYKKTMIISLESVAALLLAPYEEE